MRFNCLIVFFFNMLSVRSTLYLGSWKGSFSNFTETEGRIYLGTDFNLSTTYEMILFDGNWESDPYTYFSGNFIKDFGFTFKLTSFQLNTPENTIKNCLSDGKITIENSVKGWIKSYACEVQIEFELSEMTIIDYYLPKVIFLSFFAFLKIIEFFFSKKILESCSNLTISRILYSHSIVLSASIDTCYILWGTYLCDKGYVNFI